MTAADFAAVLVLNQASVHFLSPLSLHGLQALHRESPLCLCVEQDGVVVACVITLEQGADYASVNYRWFSDRHDRFLYVDRVVVSGNANTRGAGSALYQAVFEHAQSHGFPFVCCEFDLEPPNPRSAAFHAKFGFSEVARQSLADGKKVVSLQIRRAPFADD